MEVDKRLGIDEDAHIFKVVHAIAFSRLRVEPNVIGKTGAASALNSHPQLSLEHTNPGDPRFSAVTFRPLTVGVTANVKF